MSSSDSPTPSSGGLFLISQEMYAYASSRFLGTIPNSHLSSEFEFVLTQTPNENSVLTLEAPEKERVREFGTVFSQVRTQTQGCICECENRYQNIERSTTPPNGSKTLEILGIDK